MCDIIHMKRKITPRSNLGPAGKTRPPKVEKLNGDEVPPPEAAKARKKNR